MFFLFIFWVNGLDRRWVDGGQIQEKGFKWSRLTTGIWPAGVSPTVRLVEYDRDGNLIPYPVEFSNE